MVPKLTRIVVTSAVAVVGGSILLSLYLRTHRAETTKVPTYEVFGRVIVPPETLDPLAALAGPCGVDVAGNGTIYVVDLPSDRIVVYDPQGRPLRSIGKTGQGPGELMRPVDVRVVGRKIFVLEAGNFRVSVFDTSGAFVSAFRVAPLSESQKIAVTPDASSICLNEPPPLSATLFTLYDSNGQVLKRFGEPFPAATRGESFVMNTVCYDFDQDGNLYVFFQFRPEVRKYSAQGELLYQGPLATCEVKAKEREWKNLLKRSRLGALVTFVSDVVCAPDGSVFACTPPPVPKKATAPFVLVYRFDSNLTPSARLVSYSPSCLDTVVYAYGICLTAEGSLLGVNRESGALFEIGGFAGQDGTTLPK